GGDGVDYFVQPVWPAPGRYAEFSGHRRVHDFRPAQTGSTTGVVGSDRGALPRSLTTGFHGPPSEPAVRLSTQRALHDFSERCRFQGPWSWDFTPSTPIPGHLDTGSAAVNGPIADEPPATISEPSTKLSTIDVGMLTSNPT